ncbi:MAG: hypothetical protein HIU86_09790 [Acidobacteria bacterium]|nr:hypothetical protein [Acidobacteriota bacterium]
MRRARLAAALLLAAVLLAGCSEIPTAGPVQAGATQEPNGTSIDYLPNPPVAGASPREIVNGFVAAASAGGPFTVAKQYLTSGFATKWQPLRGVLVQEAQPTFAITGSGGTSDVSLTVPITAKVDGDGVYTPSSKPAKLDFHLVQQGGEWRIDQAADGIVLPPTAFQKLYRPQPLQFFDQTWTRLVPDLRWFFVSSSSAGSAPSTRSIVDELITGPVGPVGQGVTVNALSGAKVQAIGAQTADVVNVTLTVPESDPSTELTGRMQQQLIQSLKLPTPGSLRLVVNSRVVPPVKSLVSQSPLPVAYVVSGGEFGTVSSTGAFTEDGTSLGKRIVAAHPQAVTVSSGQGLAAVLTASHQVAVVTATATRVVDNRAGLIAPTVDQRGWVYSVPADTPSGLQASDAKGDTINLVANLPDTSITSIEASPDGTRMLVLAARNGVPDAFVAGIARNPDGSPTGLTADEYPVDLGGNTGAGIGATWVDDASVAVLVNAPDGSTDRVQLQQLGGTASSLADIPGAASIVGTTDTSDLRIRLTTGELLVSNGQPWHQESASAPAVSVLAVQR